MVNIYGYIFAGMPRKLAVYDVKIFTEHGITDITAKHPKSHIYGIVRAPPVLFNR